MGVIASLYSSILKKIHLQRKSSQQLVSLARKQKMIKREKKVAITLFLMVGSFIVAWLPYSIYGFICILGYSKDIPLVWHTIPSVFAKASILWNPLIYASRSKVMKKALAETFPFLRWLIRNPDKVQTNEQKNQTSLTLLRSRTLNSSDVVVQSSSENPAISASV